MPILTDIDLTTDPLAGRYVKTEIVEVQFARSNGELISPEGPNRYQAGDALITSSSGTRWSVSRDRFEAKYQSLSSGNAGVDGPYQAKPVPVLARQFVESFTAARSSGGDVLNGHSGDWLLQYGPGDFGIARQDRFSQVYKKYEDD